MASGHGHGDKGEQEYQYAAHHGQDERNERHDGFNSIDFVTGGVGCGGGHGDSFNTSIGFSTDFTYTRNFGRTAGHGLTQLRVESGLSQHAKHFGHMGMAPRLDHQFNFGILGR